jgi:hypothetical protein
VPPWVVPPPRSSLHDVSRLNSTDGVARQGSLRILPSVLLPARVLVPDSRAQRATPSTEQSDGLRPLSHEKPKLDRAPCSPRSPTKTGRPQGSAGASRPTTTETMSSLAGTPHLHPHPPASDLGNTQHYDQCPMDGDSLGQGTASSYDMCTRR